MADINSVLKELSNRSPGEVQISLDKSMTDLTTTQSMQDFESNLQQYKDRPMGYAPEEEPGLWQSIKKLDIAKTGKQLIDSMYSELKAAHLPKSEAYGKEKATDLGFEQMRKARQQKNVAGTAEAVANIATGFPGFIAGGLEAALTLAGSQTEATPFSGEAAKQAQERMKVVEDYVNKHVQYQPRTKAGKAIVKKNPMTDAFNKLAEWDEQLGDWTMRKTGNPYLAALASVSTRAVAMLAPMFAKESRAAYKNAVDKVHATTWWRMKNIPERQVVVLKVNDLLKEGVINEATGKPFSPVEAVKAVGDEEAAAWKAQKLEENRKLATGQTLTPEETPVPPTPTTTEVPVEEPKVPPTPPVKEPKVTEPPVVKSPVKEPVSPPVTETPTVEAPPAPPVWDHKFMGKELPKDTVLRRKVKIKELVKPAIRVRGENGEIGWVASDRLIEPVFWTKLDKTGEEARQLELAYANAEHKIQSMPGVKIAEGKTNKGFEVDGKYVSGAKALKDTKFGTALKRAKRQRRSATYKAAQLEGAEGTIEKQGKGYVVKVGDETIGKKLDNSPFANELTAIAAAKRARINLPENLKLNAPNKKFLQELADKNKIKKAASKLAAQYPKFNKSDIESFVNFEMTRQVAKLKPVDLKNPDKAASKVRLGMKGEWKNFLKEKYPNIAVPRSEAEARMAAGFQAESSLDELVSMPEGKGASKHETIGHWDDANAEASLSAKSTPAHPTVPSFKEPKNVKYTEAEKKAIAEEAAAKEPSAVKKYTKKEIAKVQAEKKQAAAKEAKNVKILKARKKAEVKKQTAKEKRAAEISKTLAITKAQLAEANRARAATKVKTEPAVTKEIKISDRVSIEPEGNKFKVMDAGQYKGTYKTETDAIVAAKKLVEKQNKPAKMTELDKAIAKTKSMSEKVLKAQVKKISPVTDKLNNVKDSKSVRKILNEEGHGEIITNLANHMADVVEKMRSGLSLTHAFKDTGAEETGAQVINMHTEEAIWIERSKIKAREFGKALRNNLDVKLNSPEGIEAMADAVLAAESPKYYKSLPEDYRQKLAPSVAIMRDFFDQALKEYEEHGITGIDFVQNAKDRWARKAEEAKTPATQQKYLNALESMFDLQYVHIPVKVWFPSYASKKVKTMSMKGTSNQQRRRAQWEALAKKYRRKINSIKDLLDVGIIEKSDINPFEIMLDYGRQQGRDFALANIRDAAIKEGWAVKSEKEPSGKQKIITAGGKEITIDSKRTWVKVSTANKEASVFKGYYVDKMLMETINEALQTTAYAGKVARFISAVKMLAFSNPFFMAYYNVQQSLLGAGTIWHPIKVVKAFKKALHDIRTNSADLVEAEHNGMTSKPYAPPFAELPLDVAALEVMTKFQKDYIQVPADTIKAAWTYVFGQGKPLSGMYLMSFQSAWWMDKLLRMTTYNTLRTMINPVTGKIYTPREAAEITALAHAKYSDVPTALRQRSNKAIFTPTFTIAMFRAQIMGATEMVRVFSGKSGPKEGQEAKVSDTVRRRAAIGLITSMMALEAYDMYMTSHGWERDIWGKTYYRPVKTSKGREKELINVPMPFNKIIYYAYAVKRAFEPQETNPLNSLWRFAKNQSTPVIRTIGHLIDNQKADGSKIVRTMDDPAMKLVKYTTYTVTDMIRLIDQVDRRIEQLVTNKDVDFPNRNKRDQKELKRSLDTLSRVLLALGVAYVHTAKPDEQQAAAQINNLQKELATDIKDVSQDPSISRKNVSKLIRKYIINYQKRVKAIQDRERQRRK